MALGLTARQSEVLYWIAQGKTNIEIGIILDASARTIAKHIERIFQRLGIENRASAMVLATDILRPVDRRSVAKKKLKRLRPRKPRPVSGCLPVIRRIG